MSNQPTVRLDDGAVNRKIIAKSDPADYRKVEQASIKQQIELRSPEAKRYFLRFWHTLQLNAYFMSEICRIQLDGDAVEKVEGSLRDNLDKVKAELTSQLEASQVLFKKEGISTPASYDAQPLEMEVSIISSFGRRYLECFEMLDRLMPMLKTLEILEVISPTEVDKRRSIYKRLLKQPALTARGLANGLRRRLNEKAATASESPPAPEQTGATNAAAASSNAVESEPPITHKGPAPERADADDKQVSEAL